MLQNCSLKRNYQIQMFNNKNLSRLNEGYKTLNGSLTLFFNKRKEKNTLICSLKTKQIKFNSLFSKIIDLRKKKSNFFQKNSKKDNILLTKSFLLNSNKLCLKNFFQNHYFKKVCYFQKKDFFIHAKSNCRSSVRRNLNFVLKVFNNDSFNTPSSLNNQSNLLMSDPTRLKRSNFSSFLLQEKRMINTLIQQSDSNSLNKKLEMFAPIFWNLTFDKGRLKSFISWYFKNYGQRRTLNLLEKLKVLGFGFATKAGISLGIDDLQIPPNKKKLLAKAELSERMTVNLYKKAEITSLERFQTVIETWHNTSELLKDALVLNFKKTDILNPVFMMAFSGARGNISQVRQLAGMRGLMADPQGQILDFPIQSNFREGLTLTEYVISCYGARKGVVDTALRTADAGYLTRRLVDVAHQVIVSNIDCGTKKGIFLNEMKSGNKSIFPLNQRLLGRVLAADVYKIINSPENPSKIEKIANRNTEINEKLASSLGSLLSKKNGQIIQKDFFSAMPQSAQKSLENDKNFIQNKDILPAVYVRSPLACQSKKFICQLCYGWSLADGHLVSVGEAVGIIAAQSIGEPGTQLTMRTFHTGGVFAGEAIQQIKAPYNAIVEYLSPIQGSLVRTPQGDIAFLTKGTGELVLKPQMNGLKFNDERKNDLTNEKKIHYKLPSYSLLFSRNKETVIQGTLVAQTGLTPSYSLENLSIGEYAVNSVIEGEMRYNNVDIVSFILNVNKENTNPFQNYDAALKSSLLSLTEKKQKQETVEGMSQSNELIEQSLNWGYVHVLAGKIVSLPLYSDFFPEKGDLVDQTSSVSQIHWVTPLNCYLSTNFLKKNERMKENVVKTGMGALLRNILPPPAGFSLKWARGPLFGRRLSSQLKRTKNNFLKTNRAIFKKNLLQRFFQKQSKQKKIFNHKKRNKMKILFLKSHMIRKSLSLYTMDLTSLHKTFIKNRNISTKDAIKNKIKEKSASNTSKNFLSTSLKSDKIKSERIVGSLQTWRQHSKASLFLKKTVSYEKTFLSLKDTMKSFMKKQKKTNNTRFFSKLDSLKKQNMVHKYVTFDRPIIYLPIKKTFYKGFGYIFSISTLGCEHKKRKPQQNSIFLQNKSVNISLNRFNNNFLKKRQQDIFFAPLSLASFANYNFKKEPFKLLKQEMNEATSIRSFIKEKSVKSAKKLKGSLNIKTKQVKSTNSLLKKELSSSFKTLHKSRILQWFSSQYETLTGGLISQENFLKDVSVFQNLKKGKRALIKPVKNIVFKTKKTTVKSAIKKRNIESQKNLKSTTERPILKLVPILRNKQLSLFLKDEFSGSLKKQMTKPNWFLKQRKVKESIFFKPRIYWSPQEFYNLSCSKNNKIYYNNTLTKPCFVLSNNQRDFKRIDCFKTGHIQFFKKTKQKNFLLYKQTLNSLNSISSKRFNKYFLKKALSSYSMYSNKIQNGLSKKRYKKPLENLGHTNLAKKTKKKIALFREILQLKKKPLSQKIFLKSYFVWGISQLISNQGYLQKNKKMSIPLLVIKNLLKVLSKKQLKKTLLQLVRKRTSLIKALKVLSLIKKLMILKKEKECLTTFKENVQKKLKRPVQNNKIKTNLQKKLGPIIKGLFFLLPPFLLQKRFYLKNATIESEYSGFFSNQNHLGQPILKRKRKRLSQVNPISKEKKRKQIFKKANVNLNIPKPNKSILNKTNKLLVKPGWIYCPQNMSNVSFLKCKNEKSLLTPNIPYLPGNVSCHKKFILPGQKIIENIQFDQQIVYAEFILTSLNNNKLFPFLMPQSLSKLDSRKKGLSFFLQSQNASDYWYKKMQKKLNAKTKTILPLQFKNVIFFENRVKTGVGGENTFFLKMGMLLKKHNSETDPLFLFNDNRNHSILTQESYQKNKNKFADLSPTKTILKSESFLFDKHSYINNKKQKKGLTTKQTKIDWIVNNNSRFNPNLYKTINNFVTKTFNKKRINTNNNSKNTKKIVVQRRSDILNSPANKMDMFNLKLALSKNSLFKGVFKKKNRTSLLPQSLKRLLYTCPNKQIFLLIRKVIEYPTVDLKKYKKCISDKFSNKIHQLNNSVLLQNKYFSNFLNKQKPTLKFVSNFPNIDFDINAYSKIDLMTNFNKSNNHIKKKLFNTLEKDFVDHSKLQKRKESQSNLKIGHSFSFSKKSIVIKKEAQKSLFTKEEKLSNPFFKAIGLGLSSVKKSALTEASFLNKEIYVSWKNTNLMDIFIEIFKNPLNNSNNILRNKNNHLIFLKNKKKKELTKNPKKPIELGQFKKLMDSNSPFLVSKVYFNNNQNPPLSISNQKENVFFHVGSSQTVSDFDVHENGVKKGLFLPPPFSVLQKKNLSLKKVQKSLILKMLSNFIFKTTKETIRKEKKISPLNTSYLAKELPLLGRQLTFWSSLFSQPCIHWNFTQNMVFGTEVSFVPFTKRQGIKKALFRNENLSVSSLQKRSNVSSVFYEAEFLCNDSNSISARQPFVKTHFLSPCFGEVVSRKKQKLFSFYQKNRHLMLTPENMFSCKLPVGLFQSNSDLSLQNRSLLHDIKEKNSIEPKHTFSYMNIGQFVFKGDSLFLKSNTTIQKDLTISEENSDSLNLNKSQDVPFSIIHKKNESFLTNKKSYRIGILSDSGQIVHINSKKVTIRRAQPIFFSGKCIFHIQHRDFVQQNRPVLSLPYLRLKTGDIVQGIPKIEQLFEGRTSFGGEIEEDSLPNLLKFIYENYTTKLPMSIAVQKSLQMIRCVLVNSIQRVYRSQGVSVSDKHIEVIVKQMTARVHITYPGASGFFRGECIDLRMVLKWNFQKLPEQRIRYEPIILGITKASLQADSFLSAASFQYTNRVLKDSAFHRKIDFLNGLKENIIIGNLIPVGTGFCNSYSLKGKKG